METRQRLSRGSKEDPVNALSPLRTLWFVGFLVFGLLTIGAVAKLLDGVTGSGLRGDHCRAFRNFIVSSVVVAAGGSVALMFLVLFIASLLGNGATHVSR